MSAIRKAFLNMGDVSRDRLPLLAIIGAALEHKPRLTRDQQRGWSTNVTFRTYNALKNQGVLA